MDVLLWLTGLTLLMMIVATVFAVLIGSLIYAMFFGPVFGAYFGKAHVLSEADKQDVYHLEQGDLVCRAGEGDAAARSARGLQQPGDGELGDDFGEE